MKVGSSQQQTNSHVCHEGTKYPWCIKSYSVHMLLAAGAGISLHGGGSLIPLAGNIIGCLTTFALIK